MNRKVRRATAAKERHQPSLIDVGSVVARLTALEKGLNTFGQVHASNAQIINQGFALQDNHIAVQYRVLNDIRKGEVLVDEHGDVALQHYHNLLVATRVVVEFLTRLSPPAPSPSITPEQIDSNLIPLPDFGGDHAGA